MPVPLHHFDCLICLFISELFPPFICRILMKALRNCSKSQSTQETSEQDSKKTRNKVTLVPRFVVLTFFFSMVPFCWYLVAPRCGFYCRIHNGLARARMSHRCNIETRYLQHQKFIGVILKNMRKN